MNDLWIGIILGLFIYSTFVTLVAALTEDEDSIIVCSIGIWWFFYGCIVLFRKYILPEINRYKRKNTFTRRIKRYEKNRKI